MKKPHLRIAVTSDCNFKCKYCTDGGEGILTNEELDLNEWKQIIKIANLVGFSHIKITGGEPLCRENKKHDIITLIQYIKSNLHFDDIQMVTNGYYLEKYAKELSKSGLNSITVSLDTAKPERFYNITGSNSLKKVIEGIKAIRKYNIPVTINCVYFKENRDEINDLIDISKNLGTRLKILDCVDFKNENNYCSFDKLYLKFQNINYDYILPPGGLGTPMRKYNIDGCEILFKDANIGTNYNSDICTSCPNYPCQDAMISLRITANGYLKRCLIRNDNLVDINGDVKSGDWELVKNKLKESYLILTNTEYYDKKWNHEKFQYKDR